MLVLSGSILFHGSLIGVAAFWPTHPVETKSVVTLIGDFGETPELPSVPELPAAPPGEPEPVQPVLKITEPVDNPPPLVEPSTEDMILATPIPRREVRATTHPVSASLAAPSNRNTSNAPAGSTASSGVGSPVAGRPGPTVRWNTPKPVYPPSFRLAHVQGRGSVRITTDSTGRVVSTTISQSTGNALLDDNTCRAARNEWSGPPNSAFLVPITYQLSN